MKMKSRRRWFTVHKYLGLVFGLFVAVNALSGSFIIFYAEIDALSAPELRLVEPGERYLPLSVLAAGVREAYPGHALLSIGRYGSTERPDYAFRARIAEASAPGTTVFVNPYTGEVLGEGTVPALLWFMHELHVNMFSGRTGQVIIGFFGIAMLVSAISGIVLWWPKPRRVARALKVKWRSPKHRLYQDIHNVSAIYLYVVMIFIILSGIILSFPEQSRAALGLFGTVRDTPRLAIPASDPGTGAPRLTLDQVERRLPDLYPNMTIDLVRLPVGAEGSYLVRLGYVDPFNRWLSAVFVAVDQYNGEILSITDNGSEPAVTEIVDVWAIVVHSGHVGGVPLRTIVFLTGFAVVVLLVTGILVWFRKRQIRLRRVSALG